jgi:hypothetical protein
METDIGFSFDIHLATQYIFFEILKRTVFTSLKIKPANPANENESWSSIYFRQIIYLIWGGGVPKVLNFIPQTHNRRPT